MSRSSAFKGPKLPRSIFDQVQNGAGNSGRGRVENSRKERRKAERGERKAGARGGRPAPIKHRQSPERKPKDKEAENQPLKSILKASKKEIDATGDGNNYSETSIDEVTSSNISRGAALRGLQTDDDEIAALERRLGVKGKMKGGAVTQDELDFLVRGSDSEDDIGLESEHSILKRKRPEDSKWLLDKRRKALGASDEGLEDDLEVAFEDDEDDEDDEGDLKNPFSEDDDLSVDDFAGFEEEEEAPPQARKQRENPYVAPASKGTETVAGKYVPPSLRKLPASDDEALKVLRRQVQGQMNRLSEANLLSILQSIEGLYKNNPRQYVTSTLVDLLSNLVTDPSPLNDTFLILHAGFATALYKTIGTDFAAQLLERLVETFDQHHSVAGNSVAQPTGKQALNIMAFLADLYTFQLTSSVLIFDYIRLLLQLSPESSLSESNTELLLRVMRLSGPQLRQDDPSALKDIVLLLQRSVSQVGEANLSVRTKFMIESINNLKNNRVKAGAAGASQIASEHTTRIKKTLGTLNTRAKANEPLRINLGDIKDSNKRGKWWLVGASWRESSAKEGQHTLNHPSKPAVDDGEAGSDVENTTFHTDLNTLARSQGMNTDIRRAVFSTLLSASDFSDAYTSLLKLRLNSKQDLEIPRVLLHCAGAEEVYNPYYTLVAKKLCQDSKRVAKAFRFATLGVLRSMGESMTGSDDVEDDDQSGHGKMSLKKVVNLAKLYSALVADGGVPITIFKTLDFTSLQPKTRTFVEVFFITVFLEANKKTSTDRSAFEAKVQSVFMPAATTEGDLGQGLRFFLKTVVEKSDLAISKGEKKIVQRGCRFATDALLRAEQEGFGTMDRFGESDGDDESD
ncbi:hypothetical protein K431DRAFT_263328 [Polychaeton citri CBS 116435]|uniref:MI domain-containing protein n=1 Tax=Polychaeton citri CBS 116435 TaxID=1314669 RepID=A0A9P4QFU3_9PEZI|nr:hypothetical protein K431DRAFT_263328 [Polychaeton citri CBS 116435]